MALFGGSKVPSLNTAELSRINEENLRRQQQIIQGLRPSLQPIIQKFEQQRTDLSGRLLPEAEGRLTQLGQDISGIGALEKQAGQQLARNFREQQFRQVPELQRSIRESLGASGLGGNVRAASSVANPILEAATASRDLEGQLATRQLENEIARKTGLATTGFETRGQALEQRFGLDKDTIDYLTSIGREDLVREAQGLLGSEEQFGSNRLAIEQARQANEIARAQAKNAQRANIVSGLTTLASAGLGGFLAPGAGFSPLGAALGAQLGGTVGNLSTGQATQFDPSLLFLLNQNRAQTPNVAGKLSLNPVSQYYR